MAAKQYYVRGVKTNGDLFSKKTTIVNLRPNATEADAKRVFETHLRPGWKIHYIKHVAEMGPAEVAALLKEKVHAGAITHAEVAEIEAGAKAKLNG